MSLFETLALPDPAPIAQAAERLRAATRCDAPFLHWLTKDVLPAALCADIVALPLAPKAFAGTEGTRSSHNDKREFASPAMRAQHPALDRVAAIFQSPDVVGAIERLCGIDCRGSYLRIEYCQDCGDFWLEPHLDIPEKLLTLQLYLNDGADADRLGTDFYDAEGRLVASGTGKVGHGLAFLPKQPGSWHGFERRVLRDTRRSLIVNYVTDAWRARHELSFPEQPLPQGASQA